MPAIKRGQYFVARYRGDNGDLILGRVERVSRRRVTLLNLLSGNTSSKAKRVLLRRNARVSSDTAHALLGCWVATQDRQQTRQLAVALAS